MNQKERDAQKRRDYKSVFSTDAGKRVLHDLMSESFVMDTTMPNGSSDGAQWREGRRSLALMILANMGKSPYDMPEIARDYEKEMWNAISPAKE